MPSVSENPEGDASRKVRSVFTTLRSMVDVPHGRMVCAHCMANSLLKQVAPISEDEEAKT